MKHKGKRDLHKLLTSVEPPRAPRDLKEKIKRDIPESFSHERDSYSPRRWTREAWSIAAVLILVVGASYITLRYLDNPDAFRVDSTSGVSSAPAMETSRQIDQTAEKELPEEAFVAGNALSDEDANDRIGASPSSPEPAGAREAPADFRAEKSQSFAPEPQPVPIPSSKIASQSSRDKDRQEEASISAAEVFYGSDESERPASSAARKAVAAGSQRIAERDNGRLDDEPTAKLSAVPEDSYAVVRSSLDRGVLPEPDDVRVNQILDSLDYGDDPPRFGDFGIYVDGGPAPFAAGGGRESLLRIGVVASEDPEANIVARELEIEMEFDPRNVARSRRVGSDDSDQRSALVSVPGAVRPAQRINLVFEIRLQPEASRDNPVGTLVVRYRRPGESKPVEIRSPIYLGNFSRNWRTSAPALQLASVAAGWAEYLSQSHAGAAVNLHELKRHAQMIDSPRLSEAQLEELRNLIDVTIRLSER